MHQKLDLCLQARNEGVAKPTGHDKSPLEVGMTGASFTSLVRLITFSLLVPLQNAKDAQIQ